MQYILRVMLWPQNYHRNKSIYIFIYRYILSASQKCDLLQVYSSNILLGIPVILSTSCIEKHHNWTKPEFRKMNTHCVFVKKLCENLVK